MPKKSSYEIDITDGFCGCGGSSAGAEDAGIELGVDIKIRLGLNHWSRAIETHSANFPHADHECTDISAVDPRRYRSTRIGIWSPECTNMGLAKGQKQVKKQLELYQKMILDPSAERSRATMWDVPRFAEYHDYEIVIVENVVEARNWRMYDAWLKAMHCLDYRHKAVYFNSMFAWPTPQSRDRMYVVFWKKGNKKPDLEIKPISWCTKCVKNTEGVQTWKRADRKFGKYGTQYVYCCPTCTTQVQPYYYAAFNCIDWSISAQRIGDRKKPLAPNTMKRINYGREKYGNRPLMIYGSDVYNERRVYDIGAPQNTFVGNNLHSLFNPIFITLDHAKAGDKFVRAGHEMLKTQTTADCTAILIQPFIVNNSSDQYSQSITEPFKTFATHIKTGVVGMPYVVNNSRAGKATSIADPLHTITGYNHQGLLSDNAINHFLSYYRGTGQASHITEPADTFAGKGSHILIGLPTKLPPIEDCTYRMLKPPEVQKGMAFKDDYIIYGTQEEQIKQLGNAVTPPAMKILVKRCAATLL